MSLPQFQKTRYKERLEISNKIGYVYTLTIDLEELKMLPKVTVIILNYNGKEYLGSLLDEAVESALNQTYFNTEIVFADNGSNDDSVENVTKKYGNKIKIISLAKNYGYCLGNNLASRYASPETKYLLFLNPDAVLAEEYVAKLVSLMENDNTIGIAQGMEVSQDGSRHFIGALVTTYGLNQPVELKEADIQPLESKKVTLLCAGGSAVIVRKELFDKVGGFSPELFMYYDEIDLGCRILCLGFRTVGILTVKYTHKIGGTIVSNRTKMRGRYFDTRNRWLIIIRYFPKNFLLHCSVAFLAELLINVYKSSFKEKEIRRESFSLYFRVVSYLIKNLRRELSIRNSYEKVQKLIANYAIPEPFPLKINEASVVKFMTEHNLWSEKLESP